METLLRPRQSRPMTAEQVTQLAREKLASSQGDDAISMQTVACQPNKKHCLISLLSKGIVITLRSAHPAAICKYSPALSIIDDSPFTIYYNANGDDANDDVEMNKMNACK
eukprot:scaffold114037_cov19-Prasinocladus_malaysianus.AAC.1